MSASEYINSKIVLVLNTKHVPHNITYFQIIHDFFFIYFTSKFVCTPYHSIRKKKKSFAFCLLKMASPNEIVRYSLKLQPKKDFIYVFRDFFPSNLGMKSFSKNYMQILIKISRICCFGRLISPPTSLQSFVFWFFFVLIF